MSEEKGSFIKSSFFIRTCSGVVLVLLALFFILTGGTFLLAGLGVISLIGVFEYDRVMKIQNNAMGWFSYILTVLYYLYLYFNAEDQQWLFIAALVVLLAVYVFRFPEYHCEQVLAAYFGLFYVPVMLSYIYRCRILDGGIYLVWLVFLSSWGCDTCAYLVGCAIGKHKMTPVLSPKKSVEGAVGGVVGALLLGALFGCVFRQQIPFEQPVLACAVICGISSVISMIGDLTASAIKRDHGVKDYGTLIPGHGGILDRFDSVIFTAPVIYYTIVYFIG